MQHTTKQLFENFDKFTLIINVLYKGIYYYGKYFINVIKLTTSMKITVLGTSCMVPTKERNVSATYLQYDGEGMLFDCGEGTQRQMSIAGIKRTTVKKIFISHWHADHVAGIVGLIQTIGNKDEQIHLDIYGPIQTKERMEHLMNMTIFDQSLDIRIHEIESSQTLTTVVENDKYLIQSISLDHSVPAIGFRFTQKDKRRINTQAIAKYNITPGPILTKFQQGKNVTIEGKLVKADDVTSIVKGRIFVYALDTAFCETLITLSENADVLLTEATYSHAHEENAHKYKHMTGEHAAQVAQMANVKRLVLSHISQRYKTPTELVEEAQAIFPKTEMAFDLLSIKLA